MRKLESVPNSFHLVQDIKEALALLLAKE